MLLTSVASVAIALGALLGARLASPHRRWVILLGASYAFYAMAAPYLPLVLASVTLLSFRAGMQLEGEERPRRRTAWLLGGLAAAVGALVVLKYTGFIRGIAASCAGLLDGRPASAIRNPFIHVGVSYWVLQVVSYLLDVSQGVVPVERHLGRYALYLAFFPKLLQGPIERPARLLPQLAAPPPLRLADMRAALTFVLWGAFQKFAVADRLGVPVDAVFGQPDRYHGLSVVLAVYLFAAQLYFDFAGYTCIAIGVGRAFGIQLSPNFDRPYLATSVADFWRRWHITFSSWILDYVFRPLQLGLRRRRTWGTPLALLVTFVFSGLWHGATWGFVAWGLLHGIYLACSVLLGRARTRLRDRIGLSRSPVLRPLQVLVTFHLVCAAWVFFRAATVGEAAALLVRAVTGLPKSLTELVRDGAAHVLFLDQAGGRFALAVTLAFVASVLPMLLPELTPGRSVPERESRSWHRPLTRSIAYAAMLYVVVFVGESAQSFIYTRF